MALRSEHGPRRDRRRCPSSPRAGARLDVRCLHARHRTDLAAAAHVRLIIYLLWRTLQVMPRVKPKHVRATSKSSVTWEEVAGLEEARAEMEEIVDFLRDSKRFEALARACQKGSSSRARRVPARRCSRRPSPTSPARASTRRAPRRSSRCSRASAPPGSASSSRRHARTLRRSSSSTSSTPSAPPERPRIQPRAGPDAKPAARRARRLHQPGAGGRHGRLEPAPGSRPGAPAPGPLRPPGPRLASGPAGARRSSRSYARQAARSPTSTSPVARQTAGLTGAELANIANEAAIFAGRENGTSSSRATSTRRWNASSRAFSSGR